jgi:Protein of unknown function (DUF5131)
VPKLDLVILGGESGPQARPMHPDWVRNVRDQCQAAGVPFFFKQWGEWAQVNLGNYSVVHPIVWLNKSGGHGTGFNTTPMWRVGTKRAGHLLDGREWREFPN